MVNHPKPAKIQGVFIMKISFGDRVFTIPEECPADGPSKETLRQALDEHGAEAFLVSRTTLAFTFCSGSRRFSLALNSGLSIDLLILIITVEHETRLLFTT